MVEIIADSTCNLPAEILRQHDIRVAPISIQFGEKTFEEGITIDQRRGDSRPGAGGGPLLGRPAAGEAQL